MTAGGNRQRPGSAADVQNVVATLQLSEVDDGLSQLALSAMGEKPREQVVAGRPVQNQSMSARCGLSFHRALHSQRRLEMRSGEEQVGRRGEEAFVADRPVKDARVRRTQRRLREAIVSLIHEKS